MRRSLLPWAGLITVLAVAFWARATDLSTHFTHWDDVGVANTIVRSKTELEIKLKDLVSPTRNDSFGRLRGIARALDKVGLLRPAALVAPSLSVPWFWTYAPLQYFFTGPILSPDQTYRELLFRGRLPSLLFGMLALVAMFFVGRMILKDPTLALLGTTLVAFSWEHVIYSKQMSNYALGTLAVLGLLALLMWTIRQEPLTRKIALSIGAALAVLCHAHYQILLFLPAFFLAWGLNLKKGNLTFKQAAKALMPTMVTTSLLILPMLLLFLRQHAASGTNWNVGPHGEYLFTFPRNIQALWYPFTFFSSNGFQAHASNFAFVPPTNAFFYPSAILLAGLVCCGLWSFVRQDTRESRTLIWFIGTSALVWLALILKGSVTLSPTRHSLIWLPPLALAVAEGLRFSLSRKPAFRGGAAAALSTIIAVLFLAGFRESVEKRRDRFYPDQIAAQLRHFGANQIIEYGGTQQITAMRKDLAEFKRDSFYGEDYTEFSKKFGGGPAGRFALASHRNPLPGYLAERFNVLHRREFTSDTEVDFLSWTHNGTNGLFFYILEAKDPK